MAGEVVAINHHLNKGARLPGCRCLELARPLRKRGFSGQFYSLRFECLRGVEPLEHRVHIIHNNIASD